MTSTRPPKRRGLVLAGTLAVGAAAGTVGFLVTGAQAWFLAVPTSLAVVWLAVADPTRCERGPGPATPADQRRDGGA